MSHVQFMTKSFLIKREGRCTLIKTVLEGCFNLVLQCFTYHVLQIVLHGSNLLANEVEHSKAGGDMPTNDLGLAAIPLLNSVQHCTHPLTVPHCVHKEQFYIQQNASNVFTFCSWQQASGFSSTQKFTRGHTETHLNNLGKEKHTNVQASTKHKHKIHSQIYNTQAHRMFKPTNVGDCLDHVKDTLDAWALGCSSLILASRFGEILQVREMCG